MKFKNANRFRNDFQKKVLQKEVQLEDKLKGKIIAVKVIPPFINVVDLDRWTLTDEMRYANEDVNAVVVYDVGYYPTCIFQKLTQALDALEISYDIKDYEDHQD